MFLIDFIKTPKESFARGFIKGLSAPALLYHTEQAPTLPNVVYLAPQTISPADSLASDWLKIGNDFKVVVEKYGQEQSAIKAA